jgi:hypothetical protein
MADDQRQDPPKVDDQNDPNQQTSQAPQGGQQQQNSSGDAGDSGDQNDGSSDSGDSSPSLEEQLDAEKKKNIALNKQLSKATEDKKKADQDRDAAKERDEYKAKNDKLQELLDSKFLVWCITTDTKYKWQNVEDVIKFINADEINIDVEKGTVDGLDLALKRIAKDKSYLLVPKEDGTGGQPSGSHPQGGKATSTIDEQKRLGAKYRIPGFSTHGQKFM